MSKQANSPPSGDKPTGSAPPLPPAWRMGVASAVSTAWIARQWSRTWRNRRHSGNGLEKHLG